MKDLKTVPPDFVSIPGTFSKTKAVGRIFLTNRAKCQTRVSRESKALKLPFGMEAIEKGWQGGPPEITSISLAATLTSLSVSETLRDRVSLITILASGK